ncbi:hypothetical protein BC332_24570 [Capsicum chinense]|nr:hypothetical protein BC332_24570 [Capsicum chinense]
MTTIPLKGEETIKCNLGVVFSAFRPSFTLHLCTSLDGFNIHSFSSILVVVLVSIRSIWRLIEVLLDDLCDLCCNVADLDGYTIILAGTSRCAESPGLQELQIMIGSGTVRQLMSCRMEMQNRVFNTAERSVVVKRTDDLDIAKVTVSTLLQLNVKLVPIGVNIRSFSYNELEEATNGFEEELGTGALSTVYKAILNDENGKIVDVKKLQKTVTEGEQGFLAEVNSISRNNHKNLVQLLGFCNEGQHRLLVYEHMETGSLADLLFKDSRLSWSRRVQVAIDTA